MLFSHTFTSSLLLTHFQFPPSFFFSSRVAFTILKKITFQTLNHSPPSFFVLPVLSPFLYSLFPFFQLHRFPVPFHLPFLFLHFFSSLLFLPLFSFVSTF